MATVRRGRPVWLGVLRHVAEFDPRDDDATCEHGVRALADFKDGRAGRPECEECIEADGVATLDGAKEARQAGVLLTEQVKQAFSGEGESPPRVVVLHACTPIARRTASLVAEQLVGADEASEVCCVLVADKALDIPLADTEKTAVAVARESLLQRDADVVVAVAHDPQASWLLHSLVDDEGAPGRRAWLHRPERLPIRRGELIMLCGDWGRYRPVWAISPASTELIEQLQSKIGSKMDSAKQLGAFSTALLVFAVTAVVNADLSGFRELLAWSGATLITLGVISFFVTLFQYDSLLMPTSMWASVFREGGLSRPSKSGVLLRPPSSAAWLLYQNMQLVWRRSFTVAVAATGLGGWVVVLGVSDPEWWRGWVLVGLLTLAAAIAGRWVWQQSRPDLGVND